MARQANGLLARLIIKSGATSPRHSCCCCCCCWFWKWWGCSGWHDVMGKPWGSPGGDDVTHEPWRIRPRSSAAGGLREVADGGGGEMGSSLVWWAGDDVPDSSISFDLSLSFLLFMRRFWNQTLTWRSVRCRRVAISQRFWRVMYVIDPNSCSSTVFW